VERKPLTRRQFVRNSALTAAGIAAGLGTNACTPKPPATDQAAVEKTRSYNPNMQYRRLGKTGLWVSAVCLGGHWKRINKVIAAKGKISPYNSPGQKADLDSFYRNRDEVVSRCMAVGINCIDLAGDSEAEVYCKVLGDRRKHMFLAYSHPASELRVPANRKASKLVELFEKGLQRCHIDYADVWRLMALERGGRHTQAESEEMIKALDIARTRGLCRYTGFSTHDRKWAKMLIETYPEVVQVVIFPYTVKSKVLPHDSLFDAIKKHDVGTLGIKPFASNALFKGDGSPNHPQAEADDQRARMVLRYILCNSAITAPIPGLISTHQVDNAAQAVRERREFDLTEKAELQRIADETWAALPNDYQWLKDWEYV